MLFDFVVTRDGLTNFCFGILIPIVFPAVPNEDRACCLNLSDEFAAFHLSWSCACRRTFGITPEERSL